MQRFVLKENILRYTQLLRQPTDARTRRLLLDLLASSRRDLALLETARWGALGRCEVCANAVNWDSRLRSRFREDFAASHTACLLLDPRPGLRIVDINDTYATLMWTDARTACGERLFDLFPENPEEPRADGMANAHDFLKTTAATGKTQRMTCQRYDMRDASGRFVARYWNTVDTPLFDDKGNLAFMLLQIEEVPRTAGIDIPDTSQDFQKDNATSRSSALR